jgi:hypothetical protein
MSLGFDTSLALHRLCKNYVTTILFCSYIVNIFLSGVLRSLLDHFQTLVVGSVDAVGVCICASILVVACDLRSEGLDVKERDAETEFHIRVDILRFCTGRLPGG